MVYGYCLVSSHLWAFESVHRICADDTFVLKDWAMHNEFVFSVLLSLLSYGFDDCNTADKYVYASLLAEISILRNE